MTHDEFDEIKSIAQDITPVMKFGDYWSGMDKQERANAFWKILAEKYGFVWDSAEGNGSDPKQFLATPTKTPVPVPDSPTQQEGEDESIRTDIAQILKDNITFAPQVDGYIVHGAIDKIIEYFSQRK